MRSLNLIDHEEWPFGRIEFVKLDIVFVIYRDVEHAGVVGYRSGVLPIWNREFKLGIVAGQELEAALKGHVLSSGAVSAILIVVLEAEDQLGASASSALLRDVGGLECWRYLEYHVCTCGYDVLGLDGKGDGNWLLSSNPT